MTEKIIEMLFFLVPVAIVWTMTYRARKLDERVARLLERSKRL